MILHCNNSNNTPHLSFITLLLHSSSSLHCFVGTLLLFPSLRCCNTPPLPFITSLQLSSSSLHYFVTVFNAFSLLAIIIKGREGVAFTWKNIIKHASRTCRVVSAFPGTPVPPDLLNISPPLRRGQGPRGPIPLYIWFCNFVPPPVNPFVYCNL